MPVAKLTQNGIQKAIKAIENNGLSIVLWDSELTGLGLRLSPKGKASWLVKARLGAGGRDAKQILHVFGHFDKLPDIDKARQLARSILVDIGNGIDPNKTRKSKRIADIDAYRNGRLKDVFDTWYDKHAKPSNDPPVGSYWYEVRRRFNVEVLPKLGEATPVQTITKQDIIQLIDNKEKVTKSGARQVFNAMNPFFLWCVSRELIPASPMAGLSPPERYEDRDRVLTEDEIKLFWKATDKLSYPWGPYYKLLLLTLQRRSEVAHLDRLELNFDGMYRNTWIIPSDRTKNNEEHLVHLPTQVIDIIDKIPKHDKSTLVFTTTGKTGISGFSKAKRDLDAEITKLNDGKPIAPWRLHDLRRTGATAMGMLKVPPHITELILNHVSGSNGGLVGIYQRFKYIDERQLALEKWNEYICKIINTSIEENNVIPFKL